MRYANQKTLRRLEALTKHRSLSNDQGYSVKA